MPVLETGFQALFLVLIITVYDLVKLHHISIWQKHWCFSLIFSYFDLTYWDTLQACTWQRSLAVLLPLYWCMNPFEWVLHSPLCRESRVTSLDLECKSYAIYESCLNFTWIINFAFQAFLIVTFVQAKVMKWGLQPFLPRALEGTFHIEFWFAYFIK